MSDSSRSSEYDYVGHDLDAMAVATNYYNWLLSLIEPYIHGHVAEIGAGIGTFSRQLLARQPETLHAFEPSPQMFARLSESMAGTKNAIPVNSTIADWAQTEASRFDSVIYFNVLEHIATDTAELRSAYLSMVESAHLVVYSPALPWLYGDFDRSVGHVRRYTLAEIKAKMVDAGFEVVQAKYIDLLGVLPWYLTMVLRDGTLSLANTRRYDRWIVPLGRRLESVISPPLGKNVLAIGRKPIASHAP
ncbi:MAG: phospholipid N-methyltransferase [Gammaproteobacteria bacterium]|jgi:phospholipid N-methyltransferase